jgi:hypothetical protein
MVQLCTVLPPCVSSLKAFAANSTFIHACGTTADGGLFVFVRLPDCSETLSVSCSIDRKVIDLPAKANGVPKPTAAISQDTSKLLSRWLDSSPIKVQYLKAKNRVCVLNGKFVRGPSG